MSFTVVVREQHLDAVRNIALDVNDPDSPNYGKFLLQDQLDDLVAPIPEDMALVRGWLKQNDLTYHQVGVSNLVVSTTVGKASAALRTRFHNIFNSVHGQSVVRATAYYLPRDVQEVVAAVFGLHGLPIPQKQPLIAQAKVPVKPASVTPDVLETTYNIKGVNVSRSIKNRQAVVEFQDQYMKPTDLETMFSKYVKSYEKGTDDVVYKHVGEWQPTHHGLEAELDIQYIMATAVGIKTEFWEFPLQDFCNDLNQWTSNLTSTSDIPIVHSVSYGWQGNMSQVHCKDSDLKVVDDNFAKLAAKGVSIMISSGDSGSGYSDTNQQCLAPQGGGKAGTALVGTVESTSESHAASDCCEKAGHRAGWTYTPAAMEFSDSENLTFSFDDTIYRTAVVSNYSNIFVKGDLQVLNGVITTAGGKVSVTNLNKTFTTAELVFSPMHRGVLYEWEGNATVTLDGQDFVTRVVFPNMPGALGAALMNWHPGSLRSSEVSTWVRRPPPPGTCTVYSEVKSYVSANDTVVSSIKTMPKAPQLWPSWPASSPWVTSVGATRFIDQQAGNPEMASDQFGSGGGFSAMFDQTDAKWQQDAVANYLKTVDQSTLPPAGSFNPKGRATPDVSALGEGYQVINNDHTTPVGGTSASSPMFAALISLLNEQRLNSNKPAMGFLNPFLYKNADAFFDVTVGSNKISRGGKPIRYGYNCSKGWDPATGLGTPKFDKLLTAAMAAAN